MSNIQQQLQLTDREILAIAGFPNGETTNDYFKSLCNVPIKRYGRVEYVFRPKTSYPARIYVFMHAEEWLTRNRLVSGCATQLPFYSRPMSREELIHHHFDYRLAAYQFEDWDRFIEHQAFEANVWDQQAAGEGTKFLKELESFRDRFDYRLIGNI